MVPRATSNNVGKFEVRMPMFCHDCMIKCNCSVKDSYIFLEGSVKYEV